MEGRFQSNRKIYIFFHISYIHGQEESERRKEGKKEELEQEIALKSRSGSKQKSRIQSKDLSAPAATSGSIPDNEDDLILAIAELETQLDHDFLIKWTIALDFDEYADNWMSVSTTGRSDGNSF